MNAEGFKAFMEGALAEYVKMRGQPETASFKVWWEDFQAYVNILRRI